MASAQIRFEVKQAITEFKFFEVEYRKMVQGYGGPVVRDLTRRAIRVQNAAKINASGRPGPNVRTGRLRGSITYRLGTDALGAYADIGSAVKYARPVEEGHDIVRNGRKVGRAPAYPFLRPALQAARV